MVCIQTHTLTILTLALSQWRPAAERRSLKGLGSSWLSSRQTTSLESSSGLVYQRRVRVEMGGKEGGNWRVEGGKPLAQ